MGRDVAATLDSAEVAERLDVSSNEVRRLLASGDLLGIQRAGRWFVPEREVRRLELLPRRTGRPYTPAACWQLLGLLDGAQPDVSPQRAWQLRRHLDGGPLDVAARLRGRATRRVLHVHRGLLADLLRADGATRSGISALEQVDADLVTDAAQAELYVTPGRFDDLVDEYVAREDPLGNVTIHVLPSAGLLPLGEAGFRALVGLDLLESGEPRAVQVGHDLWTGALTRAES